MTIENFKLKDFIKKDKKLIEKYIVALQYVKPRKTEKTLFHMKLKHVEFIRQNLYSNDDAALLEIISRVQGVDIAKVLDMKIIKFFGLVASVKDQMNKIADAEDRSLSSDEINFKWIAVNGTERMAKFGIYNTLDNLADGDGLKFEKWMNEKYSKCLTILIMKKTQKDLKREMDAIKTTNN